MVPFGEVIVVVDANSSLHVLDIEDGSRVLQIDSAGEFTISAIIHPATYLNKVVVGSTRGNCFSSVGGPFSTSLLLC